MISSMIATPLAGNIMGSVYDAFVVAESKDEGSPAGPPRLIATPHTYWNPGPGRVRYPLVMTANIYRLIKEIHGMPDRSAGRRCFEDLP
jgi:hypothetical protein